MKGSDLIRLRGECGLTQNMACELLGICRSAICLYEADEKRMPKRVEIAARGLKRKMESWILRQPQFVREIIRNNQLQYQRRRLKMHGTIVYEGEVGMKSEELQAALELLDISQGELARRLGLRKETVHRWVRGVKGVPRDVPGPSAILIRQWVDEAKAKNNAI